MVQWFCLCRGKKKKLFAFAHMVKNLTVKIPNIKIQLKVTKTTFCCNDVDDTYTYECARNFHLYQIVENVPIPKSNTMIDMFYAICSFTCASLLRTALSASDGKPSLE